MKKNLILTVGFCLIFGLTGAMAASINDGYVFSWDTYKDHNKISDSDWEALSGAFEFVFWENADTDKVNLTFRITDEGYDGLINIKKDEMKFKDFYLIGFNDLISNPTFENWDNGGWTPTTNVYTFETDIDWYAFVEAITSEDFNGYILAHIQSAENYVSGWDSINEAIFRYKPDGGYFGNTCPEGMSEEECSCLFGFGDCNKGGEAPEPGSILLLGTGIVGFGLVARRKMAKK